MALGAITKVTGADYTSGNKRVRVRDVQLTTGANYTTGGEIITPAAVGLNRRIESVSIMSARTTTGGAGGIPIAVDYTAIAGSPGAVKLQAYRYDGASAGKAFLEEVAASVDLSTFSARLRFEGV